jgi:hypothetical protein
MELEARMRIVIEHPLALRLIKEFLGCPRIEVAVRESGFEPVFLIK